MTIKFQMYQHVYWQNFVQ